MDVVSDNTFSEMLIERLRSSVECSFMLIISLSYYIGVLSSRLKPRLKHLGVLSSRLKPRLKNIPKRIKINLILVVGASVEVLTTLSPSMRDLLLRNVNNLICLIKILILVDSKPPLEENASGKKRKRSLEHFIIKIFIQLRLGPCL